MGSGRGSADGQVAPARGLSRSDRAASPCRRGTRIRSMSSVENLHTIKISRAAELLLWSRDNQTCLRNLPADLIPRDLNEAYEIQLAVALLRHTPTAGFKLGLTNEAAQRAADTFAPIV